MNPLAVPKTLTTDTQAAWFDAEVFWIAGDPACELSITYG